MSNKEQELRTKILHLAHSKPELRSQLLPLLTEKEAASKWTGKDFAEEIINTEIGGADISQHIKKAVQQFLLISNEVYEKIEAAQKEVEDNSNADSSLRASGRAELLKLVKAKVEYVWGDSDPGADLFAKMFLGHYTT